jgi:hypothetical protein
MLTQLGDAAGRLARIWELEAQMKAMLKQSGWHAAIAAAFSSSHDTAAVVHSKVVSYTDISLTGQRS